MVKVLVYSNEPILSVGLESVISSDPAFRLCASCGNIPALREHLSSALADLAILDLTPELSGTLSGLQSLAPQCRFILWANSISPEFAMRALTMGVRGVLRKTLPPEGYLNCLRRVQAGNLWFERTLTDRLRTTRQVMLTPREGQLLSHLSQGCKNKEIATAMGLTEGTVKVYLSHLLQKTGAKDRYDLAIQGMKTSGIPGVAPQGPLHSLLIEAAASVSSPAPAWN